MFKTRISKARKISSKLLGLLNAALADQLTAISTYLVQSELCAGWGYLKLHALLKKEAIEEMHHVHLLMERIVFFDEVPKMKLKEVNPGSSVEDMISHNIALEEGAIRHYNLTIQQAREDKDNGTAELIERLLKDEENHYDWLTSQQTVIQQVGLDLYLDGMREEPKKEEEEDED
jgi:bacterioferritin